MVEMKRLSNAPIKGKKALVRVDFNVPQDDNGRITDDTRIRAYMPTIEYLRKNGASVILVSHLGRPKGKPDLKYSLKPIGEYLSKLLGANILFAPDSVGEEAVKISAELKAGDILLLENIRFYAGEEKNDQELAKKLSALADIFINDAFSAAHRAHSSTRGVSDYLPSYAGLVMEKEVDMLAKVKDNPDKPFILILGGAKVSDKIKVIENLLPKVDGIIIGGGMAFTFLKAKRFNIGRSLCEEDRVNFAREMLSKAEEMGKKILLPSDVVVAAEIDSIETKVVRVDSIPSDMMGLDIGCDSRKNFTEFLQTAKTILWNGPVGVFEKQPFAEGTKAIAKAVSELDGCMTVIGGGDTAAAVKIFGFENGMSHISTGGGASLEFFEGEMLPGLEPLIMK